MHNRLMHGILIGLALLIVAGQALAQGGVKVEYKFTSGELLRYKVLDKTSGGLADIGGTGSGIVAEGVLRLRVSKVLPNGDAEIRAAYERGTLKAIGETKNISADYVPPITFQVSKNGVIKDGENLFKNSGWVKVTRTVEGGSESMTANVYASVLAAIFREYPGRELKVGETWKQAASSISKFDLMEGTSKLVSVSPATGESQTAVITTTGDETDTSTINAMGSDAGSMDTRAVLDTKVTFSIKKGCVVAVDEKIALTMSADGESSTTTMLTQASLLPEEKGGQQSR